MAKQNGRVRVALKGGVVFELQGHNVKETFDAILKAQIEGGTAVVAHHEEGGINILISEVAGVEFKKGGFDDGKEA